MLKAMLNSQLSAGLLWYYLFPLEIAVRMCAGFKAVTGIPPLFTSMTIIPDNVTPQKPDTPCVWCVYSRLLRAAFRLFKGQVNFLLLCKPD